MASITQRGKGSYRLKIELGYDANGNRITKTKTVRPDEATLKSSRKLTDYLNTELAKFKAKVEAGEYISLEKLKFEQFTEIWRTRFVEKKLSDKTIENYLYHLYSRLIPHFGHMQMDKIKTMHIMDYLDKLENSESMRLRGEGKLGAATVVYNYRVLESIFKWAKEWKVIEENPMTGVPARKDEKKEMMVFDEDEVAIVFEALQNEPNQLVRTLVTLALTTGLRRAELLGLEWKHINLDKGIIEVKQSIPMFKKGEPVIKGPKNVNSVRKVAIPPSFIGELSSYQAYMKKERFRIGDKWANDNFFLFCNLKRYGIPYYPKTLSEMWAKFIKKLPVKYIRFHDLRHTSATILINSGVHAKVISKRLGHSKIATTMDVYGHVIESADVGAASKFDAYISGKGKGQQA